MLDERSLYIKQLLRNYKQSDFYYPDLYTVNFNNGNGESYRVFNHNEGIDFAIEYIEELEDKIRELEYIERIIKTARGSVYGY